MRKISYAGLVNAGHDSAHSWGPLHVTILGIMSGVLEVDSSGKELQALPQCLSLAFSTDKEDLSGR